MKGFLILLILVAVLAGVALFWWRHNSTKIMNEQATLMAKQFFVNPENVSATVEGLKMISLRDATISKVVITGNNAQIVNCPYLSTVKIVLTDVAVTAPPVRMTAVGGGHVSATISDSELTDYLRQRGASVARIKVPVDSLTVTFPEKNTVEMKSNVTLPIIRTGIGVGATGNLVPASNPSHIDFQVKQLKFQGMSVTAGKITDVIYQLNPMISFSSLPVQIQVKKISIEKGSATVSGAITGVR